MRHLAGLPWRRGCRLAHNTRLMTGGTLSTKLHLLMPTYNRAHMLERTISALYLQDADPASWHLTVVDNASTDGTRDYLEACAARWSNFDFVINERNLGLFGNLNRCMDLARTQKFMIIHSDDDVDPSLVSSVLTFIDRHPTLQMCFGTCRALMEDTGEIIPHWYESKIIGEQDRVLSSNELLGALMRSASNFVFAPTVVYDRTFFSSDLRYSQDYKLTSDLDLWFRAAIRDPTVGFMAVPRITCRIHSERLSHEHAKAMRLEAVAIIRKHLSEVRRHGPKVIDTRLALFISAKLRLFELAIRFGLVPAFKARRMIASALESLAPKAKNHGVTG
jgi:glycosyltransferase involved in cell wall biosynthesis